jgi:hypothetical protein
MTTQHNGFRFAELACGESLCSPTACDCCGREDLKRTVKLINPEGCVVWFGTGCAAVAMGLTKPAVRKAKKAVEDAAESAERAANDAARKVEDSRWQAFLDAQVGKADRFTQIEKLGGYAKARAKFVSEAA